MKTIEFDVEITAAELYRFTMRHTYMGISGLFGLLISLVSWIILGIQFASLDNTARMALFIIGLLFTVIQPVMLFFKSKAQVRKNKNINAVLHYSIDEMGIHVTQGEQQADVRWWEVRKKVVSGKNIYLYMSPVRAFIFPEGQCGGDFDELNNMLSQMLEKYKDYVPESEDGGVDGKAENNENE